MASRTIATLTDDIYGGDAEETARFTFNGTQYEIDLSKKSVDEMVKAAALTTTTAARATAALTTGVPTGSQVRARTTRTWRPHDQLARIRSRPQTAAPTATRSPTAAASRPLYQPYSSGTNQAGVS